eukprot:TRINITY_DN12685_c0_g1_i5.p1 TRINITY_DN12685_c0_g1~~TRINITY_DN12685_c0_g1_i5.p1  ORF type:complete len:435 (-),score=203.26 TRINITY_DN12685_c0_g1_i5:100-1404(-)
MTVVEDNLLTCSSSEHTQRGAVVKHWQLNAAGNTPVLVRRLLVPSGDALHALASSNNSVIAVGDSGNVLSWELEAGELLDLQGVLMQAERDKTPVPSPRSMQPALMQKPELLGAELSHEDDLLALAETSAVQEHRDIQAQLEAMDADRRAKAVMSPEVDWAGRQLSPRHEQDKKQHERESHRRAAAAAAQDEARSKQQAKAAADKAAVEAKAAAEARAATEAKAAAEAKAAEVKAVAEARAAAEAKAAAEIRAAAAEAAAELEAAAEVTNLRASQKAVTRERKLSKWEMERDRQAAAAIAHEQALQDKQQAAAREQKILAAASGMLADSDTDTESEAEGAGSSSGDERRLSMASSAMLQMSSESDSEEEPAQAAGSEDSSLDFMMEVLEQVSEQHAAEGDLNESASLQRLVDAASPKHATKPPPRSKKNKKKHK